MQSSDTECQVMDLSSFVTVLLGRVARFEPELVSKIIGCILLKDYTGRERIRIAYGPDSEVLSLIEEAKAIISRTTSASLATTSAGTSPTQPTYWDSRSTSGSDKQPALQNNSFVDPPYADSIHDDCRYLNNNYVNDYNNYQDAFSNSRTGRRSQSIQVKPCHYHYKGYCKHGTSCRFFHGQPGPESISQALGPNSNELANEGLLSPGNSLERLEVELTELLKSRGGQPVSIAMLPTMYFEMYGKALQAEGYMTESQRHGKAGCNLTKLLARLKNSIRLLDRPHGQHSVMLAEDVPRYLEYRNERSDQGSNVSSSQQIYLTFPAESTFTEEDVADYFNHFGTVMAVRIPAQEERMYGFVTFDSAKTVENVFAKRNPHYVCGARVLVKPYKEKTRSVERRHSEKAEFPMYYSSPYVEMDSGIHSIPTVTNSRILRKPFGYENSQQLALELRRLSQLQIAPRQPYFSYGMEATRNPEDDNKIPLTNHISHQFDVSNNVTATASDQNPMHANDKDSDSDCSEIELPDSPFSSPPTESNLSTTI